jgi:hypothetical protein
MDSTDNAAAFELATKLTGILPIYLTDRLVVQIHLDPYLEGQDPLHTRPHHIVGDIYQQLLVATGHIP